MNIKYYSIILALLIFAYGCENNIVAEDDISIDDIDVVNDTAAKNAHLRKVKKIFYSVPSPVEMTALMERAGAEFNPSILNPVDNIENYISINKMALNLGVYGADLSYTRIFDQIQITVNYLSGIKKLSQSLGIPQDKGAFAVERLEQNLDNKDSLLSVITETYSAADEYLKQNNRGNTAALIVTGGWIEGLYIAVNIVGEEENYNEEILNRIAEQKYSIANLVELLSLYSSTDERIHGCLVNLEDLKTVFDKVEIVYTKGEILTNEKTKTTTITSKANIKITPEILKEIKTSITKIRKEIVK